jgi:hypothetical protein
VADPESLEGIAAADAQLGRPVPLPTVPLPLARWVDVVTSGPGAVEVCWNLDDTRAGQPGRLALYVGLTPPPERPLRGAAAPEPLEDGLTHRQAPLVDAQPSLRPVQELCWQRDGLHFRLTGQGPWPRAALVAVARSVTATP